MSRDSDQNEDLGQTYNHHISIRWINFFPKSERARTTTPIFMPIGQLLVAGILKGAAIKAMAKINTSLLQFSSLEIFPVSTKCEQQKSQW